MHLRLQLLFLSELVGYCENSIKRKQKRKQNKLDKLQWSESASSENSFAGYNSEIGVLQIPWNSMELDKSDIKKIIYISKYYCWYLINDYMLSG